jgi:hypothetical protein
MKNYNIEFTKEENLVLNRLISDNIKKLEDLKLVAVKLEDAQIRINTVNMSQKAIDTFESILFKIENLTK